MQSLDDIDKFNEKMKRVEKLLFLGRFFRSKKIILTTLEEETEAIKLILTTILRYYHVKEIITLTNDTKENTELLKKKIAKDLGIEKEVNDLLKIIEINKKHKTSPVEFMRKGSVIILDENQNIQKISKDMLRDSFGSIKKIKQIFSSHL